MKWGHGKLKTHFYLRVCPLCFRFWIPKSLIPHGKHTLIIFVLLKNCQNHSVQCTRLVSLRHASIFQTNTFVIAGICVQTAATMFKLPHIWSNFHNIFTIFDIKKRLLSYIHPLLPQTNIRAEPRHWVCGKTNKFHFITQFYYYYDYYCGFDKQSILSTVFILIHLPSYTHSIFII